MPDDESRDVEVQQAVVRSLLAAAYEHITAGDGGQAVEAFNAAGEAALKLLEARVDSDGAPSDLSDDDVAAWRLVSRASDEYRRDNNQLGDWYREGARRRALERYNEVDF
jgi:hypothetical protein